MNQKKTKSLTATSGKGQFLVYSTEDGEIKIDVRLENETVWVTQADMANLFQCSADNISLHLKNIYDDGELQSGATTEDFSVVRKEGNRQVQRDLAFYNLDAFLNINDRDILTHAGKVSHEMARELAEGEYEKFSTLRLTEETNKESDFDKLVKQLPSAKKKGKKK